MDALASRLREVEERYHKSMIEMAGKDKELVGLNASNAQYKEINQSMAEEMGIIHDSRNQAYERLDELVAELQKREESLVALR